MKFKNITKQDLTIPDVGLVKAGETKEMPEGFHNANFEEVKTSNKNSIKVDETLNNEQ